MIFELKNSCPNPLDLRGIKLEAEPHDLGLLSVGCGFIITEQKPLTSEIENETGLVTSVVSVARYGVGWLSKTEPQFYGKTATQKSKVRLYNQGGRWFLQAQVGQIKVTSEQHKDYEETWILA